MGATMAKWNMPPIAKVYEALSAVADGRVKLTSETTAEVQSSARDKTYTVRWADGAPSGSPYGRGITSNDNATRWQGYTGYPIVAVLLQVGRLSYDPAVAAALAGVPWHSLNERFKRDYDAAIDHVLAQIREAGGDPGAVRAEAERIYAALAELQLERPEAKRSGSKKEGR
jgi:hypothetical protein